MSDTCPTPRRKTIVARLVTAGCVLACLAAIPLQTAGAEEPQKLASDADIEEMAGALGYSGSKDEGFWEALAQAVADQRAAAQEKADSEHAQQFQQAWADAAKYGRRLEETVGRITLFTELIPPADGDIEQGEVLVRTGEEFAQLDGTRTVVTTYWKYGKQVGVVASVVDDDVETVTQVIEYEPGSIDAKVGDERPVPAPGSSAAGLKPHTIDPKADGSLGRASGGLPDGGDKIEPAPAEETAGTRWWFDPIKLPDGRVITPFVEERPPASLDDLAYRTGYLIEHPDWDGAAEITIYFDVQGKIAGVTGAVIQGGTDTLAAVEEVTPGSLGLKKGDSRTRGEDLLKSNKPSAWEPKPQSGTGSTPTGGSQPTGSTTQNGTDPQKDSDPASPDPANTSDDDDTEAPAPSGSTTGGQTSTTSSGDSHPEYVFLGQGPARQNEDGSTSQNTLYQRTADGVYVQTITTTQKDGSQSQEQHCYKDSQQVDCGAGMTDEPTCQVDCARLEALTGFFACASGPVGAECGQAPEGLQPNPLTGPDCPSGDKSVQDTGSSGGGGFQESVALPDCSNVDKPGGPLDYGDPTDPNGAEPADTSQIDRLLNDGVTDPTGEPEEIAAGSIRLDTYGTLGDPANPPGTEDEVPAPGAPTTGDAERNPLP
jgi:hypothetical protein